MAKHSISVLREAVLRVLTTKTGSNLLNFATPIAPSAHSTVHLVSFSEEAKMFKGDLQPFGKSFSELDPN